MKKIEFEYKDIAGVCSNHNADLRLVEKLNAILAEKIQANGVRVEGRKSIGGNRTMYTEHWENGRDEIIDNALLINIEPVKDMETITGNTLWNGGIKP